MADDRDFQEPVEPIGIPQFTPDQIEFIEWTHRQDLWEYDYNENMWFRASVLSKVEYQMTVQQLFEYWLKQIKGK